MWYPHSANNLKIDRKYKRKKWGLLLSFYPFFLFFFVNLAAGSNAVQIKSYVPCDEAGE
jgi:hypothetical protein